MVTFTALVNGTIVTESESFLGTLLLQNDTINSFLPPDSPLPEDCEVLDCTDRILFPGAIDPHVHLEYFQGRRKIRSADDFYTGSVAAALGGTSCLIDFCETNATLQNDFKTAIKERSELMNKAVLPIGLHMTVAGWDIKRMGETLNIEEFKEAMELGCPTFKIYTAYRGLCLTYEYVKTIATQLSTHFGDQLMIIVHAEDNETFEREVEKCKQQALRDPRYVVQTRPSEGEGLATYNVCNAVFSSKSNDSAESIRLHIVHVSCSESVKAIDEFKDSISVSGEACVQHLMLTDEVYQHDDVVVRSAAVMAPVLRSSTHNDALWTSLKQEQSVTMTATDHCPFQTAQRLEFQQLPTEVPDMSEPTEVPAFWEMPGGGAGIQLRVPLLIEEAMKRGFDLPAISRIIATNAAKRFGLYHRKGVLKVGHDADVIIYNPKTVASVTLKGPSAAMTASPGDVVENVDVSLYNNRIIKGYPESLFVEGKLVVKDFKFTGESSRGGFIKRKIQ
ncbi:hypothetical protein GEMRC1_013402 [Eukaryota sp. GEM-RC1]